MRDRKYKSANEKKKKDEKRCDVQPDILYCQIQRIKGKVRISSLACRDMESPV